MFNMSASFSYRGYDIFYDASEQFEWFTFETEYGTDIYCDSFIVALMCIDERIARQIVDWIAAREEALREESEWQEHNDYNKW